jgi:hypothetical protein
MSLYSTHVIVYTFSTHFGDYVALASNNYLPFWCFFDTITIIPVQVFYMERAYKIMGNNRWLLTALCFGLWVPLYSVKV